MGDTLRLYQAMIHLSGIPGYHEQGRAGLIGTREHQGDPWR